MQHTNVALALAKRFCYAAAFKVAAIAGRITLSAAQEMDAVGLRITEACEACRLTAYQDSVGVWTIGYGHTGRDVHPGQVITLEQAEELLRQDMLIAELAVNHDVHVPLTQNQFDALCDLVFNIGGSEFSTSHLLLYLNEGFYTKAADEFPKWNHAGGKVLPGLTKRREAERQLFLRPDSEPISLSATGSEDFALSTLIERVMLEDIEVNGPIITAVREALDQ